MATEKWAAVFGFEGHYEISTHGRLRSLTRRVPTSDGRVRVIRGRARTGYWSEWGIYRYSLCREAKRRTRQAHRMMWESFVSGKVLRFDEMIGFRDGNPRNLKVDNLYADPSHYKAARKFDVALSR